ncbi:DUF2333 family protein [Methylomarinum sp. Ch1-1]|uniref:DUF2333 family protein n=1 Tax=Methylomarinum roseum TaxID=3067653 RepID=A0AAU7NVG4_9GAMM|nr:DUF2333 family protein [Methylomarinum sp. Ch1-1]MDP4523040.1 DUF2333 family protein [Methylomarinum sp. Ch1-1]
MSDSTSAHEDAKSKGILWGFGSFLGIVALILIILGEWWGSEPGPFNVQEEAIKRMEVTHTDQMPVGYVYANTLAHIAEVLMYKPGGYISNDVAPPGVLIDNIQNWEHGALIMLRDATTALRNHFSRDQSQSAEDKDLAKAEPYFYYERNSWALPSTESEYEKGIESLHDYMLRLQDPNAKNPAQFYSRADNLWQYVEIVIKRLGGLSTRLGASTDEFSGAAHGPPTDPEDLMTSTLGKTPWLEIDDVFYEARGACWALLHILKAVKHDFADILLDKRAMNTVDIMIHSMEQALTPVLSPMILNGGGFGLFANYSLAMANYIARANASALDLRDIMNRG